MLSAPNGRRNQEDNVNFSIKFCCRVRGILPMSSSIAACRLAAHHVCVHRMTPSPFRQIEQRTCKKRIRGFNYLVCLQLNSKMHQEVREWLPQHMPSREKVAVLTPCSQEDEGKDKQYNSPSSGVHCYHRRLLVVSLACLCTGSDPLFAGTATVASMGLLSDKKLRCASE